jgi:hypothetical protein
MFWNFEEWTPILYRSRENDIFVRSFAEQMWVMSVVVIIIWVCLGCCVTKIILEQSKWASLNLNCCEVTTSCFTEKGIGEPLDGGFQASPVFVS